MSTAFLALLMGLGQGLLHGLGPDHCAAVATLGSSTRGDRRAAVGVAIRFALGHAAVLGVLAGVCLLMGVGLSETFEQWAEIFGGGVLLAVALAALFFPGVLSHGHPHFAKHADGHVHLGRGVGTAAGALMAISGARGLLLALPPLVIGGSFSAAAWTYLPGFALGVLVSMAGFGWLWSLGISRLNEAALRWTQRGVAVASAALGLFWIAARV